MNQDHDTPRSMKIAIATHADWQTVSGHAGQTRTWLLYDCRPGEPTPMPMRIELDKAQLPHHFHDEGPHPLHGVDIMVCASAGDGFVRRMGGWGATVLLTGETEAQLALQKILAGETLADRHFDVTTVLCKLRDLVSRH